MNDCAVNISFLDSKLLLKFSGELSLYVITKLQEQTNTLNTSEIKYIDIDLEDVTFLDTSAAIFINNLKVNYLNNGLKVNILSSSDHIKETLALVKNEMLNSDKLEKIKKDNVLERLGKYSYNYYIGLFSFFHFLGNLFSIILHNLSSVRNIRFREIAFEIHDSGIRALPIIALTSFLIGLVVAYQSAYQLKIYGANIFLVDMLGISVLRELAPLITAIVIAGRSGSSYTAQIGAMKITEELDAMRTMGFNPYIFLVAPRIIALMIAMPILIFIADIMAIIGGMLVANIDLQITTTLFLDRFVEVVAAKHFFIGILKGPFFAFLIATIGIYRGMMVKDDTQSIGYNTTKSVVEAIFAVIVCDAVFSIIFTNMGI